MSAGTVIVIVIVAAIALVALVVVVIRQSRRRELRRRFGIEYDRLVDDRESRQRAEAELLMRQRHVGELGIRPLEDKLRDRYAAQWAATQEKFVDTPASAVADAQHLVNAVMRDCGYPLDNREQVISDLSVDHANTLDHFRAVCEVSERVTAGTASTEDMRQAMIHFRVLFAELLGEPEARIGALNGQAAGQPTERIRRSA
jgi:FtsZ-interacting cell division protein ZipA